MGGDGVDARLVVVGALNVDLVVAARTLPGPGETVVGADLQQHGGGKGGNSAVAAARSGAAVRYVGAVGDDDLGEGALRELSGEGIDLTDVAIKRGSATGAALIVVDARGENQIAVAAGANAAVSAEDVTAAIVRSQGWTNCVLISTEIAMAAVVAAARAASKHGWTCILNPAPVDSGVLDLLEFSPILTPNRGELRDLYRLLGEERDAMVDEMAATVAQHTNAPVVVTLGVDGVIVCDAQGAITRIPAVTARQVTDTTGAGDTFNGVFAATVAMGAEVVTAARRGVAAAALSVEAAGARTGMPSAAAIDAALEHASGTGA